MTSGTDHQEDIEMVHSNNILARILLVDSETVCVEFSNKKGSLMSFVRAFKELSNAF